MMEAVHATEEWQRAGVHYIRIQAMCVGFDIPLKYEFADDTKDSEYILVHENGFPVSTCRVRIDEENAGHIERVATLEEYRGKHYGALGIKAKRFSRRITTSDFLMLRFPMTNGRSLTMYRSLSHKKRRQQLLDHLVEENQHFAI